MTNSDQRESECYCIPLEKRAGVYSASQAWIRSGADLFDLVELERRLVQGYTRQREAVDLPSGIYLLDVFVPPEGVDDFVWTIVTAQMEPPDGMTADEPAVDAESFVYLEAVRARLSVSEGLLPEQSCYLWTEFVQPQLCIWDRSPSEARALSSWHELADAHRILIVGHPGAGKTTLLRRLLLDFSERDVSLRPEILPIYIQLRRWTEGESVERAAKRELAEMGAPHAAGRFHELAASGRVILLLDGLDEVPMEWRSAAGASIVSAALAYQACKILVTTRPSISAAPLHGFSYCELIPFSQAQMKELCWHKLEGNSPTWNSFWVRLSSENDLMDIGSNPFALSHMVSRFMRNEVSPHFVNESVRLIIEALVDEWDSTRGICRTVSHTISPVQRLGLLRRLAEYLLAQNRMDFATSEFRDIIERIVAGRTAIATLKMLEEHTGLVRQTDNDRWRFSSVAMLEYLGAQAFLEANDAAPHQEYSGELERMKMHRLWRYACAQASNAERIVLRLLANSRHGNDSAIILLKALTQDLLLESAVVQRCATLVIDSLAQTLDGVELRDSRETEDAGRDASIYIVFPNKTIPGDRKAARMRDAVQLLTWVCASRDGSAAALLRERLGKSDKPVIRRIATFCAGDGAIEMGVVPGSDGNVLRMNVGRATADST